MTQLFTDDEQDIVREILGRTRGAYPIGVAPLGDAEVPVFLHHAYLLDRVSIAIGHMRGRRVLSDDVCEVTGLMYQLLELGEPFPKTEDDAS